LLLEFLNNNIRTGDDLARVTGVPFLASVPLLSARLLKHDGQTISPEQYVIRKPMSSYGEALRTIRTSIVLSSAAPPKVIAILSALPAEGKSTVAFSLARSMSLSGDNVILLDCDLRRGRLQDAVGINPKGGLVEVLTGKIALADAIMRDSLTQLDVLPVQNNSFTPADLFSGDAMTKLLADLRGRYDFVILDTAPLLAVADSRIIAALADASIFVARSERTPRRAAQAAIVSAMQGRAEFLGSVLSMSSVNARRLSSSDPAYYVQRYRQYHDG
jgi:polysaccharide biosynthesis transport protein